MTTRNQAWRPTCTSLNSSSTCSPCSSSPWWEWWSPGPGCISSRPCCSRSAACGGPFASTRTRTRSTASATWRRGRWPRRSAGCSRGCTGRPRNSGRRSVRCHVRTGAQAGRKAGGRREASQEFEERGRPHPAECLRTRRAGVGRRFAGRAARCLRASPRARSRAPLLAERVRGADGEPQLRRQRVAEVHRRRDRTGSRDPPATGRHDAVALSRRVSVPPRPVSGGR